MASLMFGITATVYGFAMLIDHTNLKWLGGLAIAGGVATIFAGVVMAYTGFSRLAIAINMSANSILLTVGVFMWRRGHLRWLIGTSGNTFEFSSFPYHDDRLAIE